jgi:ataxin-10
VETWLQRLLLCFFKWVNLCCRYIEESLSLLRRLTEREVRPSVMSTPGDVVTAASAMGLPRLLLGLTAAMPPPMGAGQTSKAGGPTAAPKLNPEALAPPALREGHAPYPSARPWEGYRVVGRCTLASS